MSTTHQKREANFDPARGRFDGTFDGSNRDVCLNCPIPYGCDENSPMCRLVKRHYSRKPTERSDMRLSEAL